LPRLSQLQTLYRGPTQSPASHSHIETHPPTSVLVIVCAGVVAREGPRPVFIVNVALAGPAMQWIFHVGADGLSSPTWSLGSSTPTLIGVRPRCLVLFRGWPARRPLKPPRRLNPGGFPLRRGGVLWRRWGRPPAALRSMPAYVSWHSACCRAAGGPLFCFADLADRANLAGADPIPPRTTTQTHTKTGTPPDVSVRLCVGSLRYPRGSLGGLSSASVLVGRLACAGGVFLVNVADRACLRWFGSVAGGCRLVRVPPRCRRPDAIERLLITHTPSCVSARSSRLWVG